MNRRSFVHLLTCAPLASLPGSATACTIRGRPASDTTSSERLHLSLSQWSFHREIFGNSRADYDWYLERLHSSPDDVLMGDMDPRDIVVMARKLDVPRVDLVNVLWFGHAADTPWLTQFAHMAENEGVEFGCLMCDESGHIGSSSRAKRRAAIEQHKPWLDAASKLGCTQLRVNAYGDGSYLDQLHQNAESLNTLAELGEERNLEILVENHGHPSSTAAWLAMLMEHTGHPNVGVYTDLDNFFMGGWGHDPQRRYDRIQGLEDLAPYTRSISAKSYDFDERGDETSIDFYSCIKLLVDAGFSGPVCAEYEGQRLSDFDGSLATIELIRSVRARLG